VKVKGTMGEWQGRRQLRIQKIRPSQPSDNVSPEDFVMSAPESGECMLAFIHETADRIEHTHIRDLLKRVLAERHDLLLIAPAASRNHHAVRGGLLYHITTMIKAGLSLLTVYPFLNCDLLMAGIILHDMAKLDEMVIDPLGVATEYSVEGDLLGHLVLGVTEIDRLSREVGMDRETSLLLKHMILSHHYAPEFGSPKRPAFPEAELLHFLDVIDARLYDMNVSLSTVPVGSLSDRIWRLDNRKLYNYRQSED
jgi:3'-5' exoribonuclease